MNINYQYISRKIYAVICLVIVLLYANSVSAASFNTDPTDKATLRVMNATTYPGSTANWVTSLNANPGDDIAFAIYYHVTSPDAADDVRVTLTPQTSGSQQTHYFTATVRASNASAVTGSATVYLPQASTMSFVSGSVIWRANQTVTGSQPLLYGQNGSEIVTSGGLRLGDIPAGWYTQGSIVLKYHISGVEVPEVLPSVSISANPQTILSGMGSRLSWTSSNTNNCLASKGWSGYKSTSGSEMVYPVTTTTYAIACSDGRDLSTDSVTVYVNPAPVVVVPSVSLHANPQSINHGSASVLTWTSSNATSCYASGGWSGNKSLSGSEAVYPSGTTTYSIICSNNQNVDSGSVTIYVNVPSPPPPIVYTPSVSMSANPQSINQGSASMLTWTSSNATLCSASGGWSGYKSTSGSETVYPGSATTYSLSCSNNQNVGSNSVTIYVNVSIPPPPPPPPPVVIPTVSISASPANIIQGSASVLSWNAYNATSCYASGGWSGHRALSGSETVYPFTTTVYSMTCSNNQNVNSASATVYVTSPPVPPQPQKLFATACATDPNYAAIGRNVVFYAAFSGGVEPVRYSWSGDIAGSGASYIVPFSVPGLKLAHLTAVDATGKTATNNCSVYVYPATARVVPPPAPTPVAVVPPPVEKKTETAGNTTEVKDSGRDFGILFSSILFTADGNPRSGFLLLMYFFIFAVIMLVLFAGYSMIGKKQ